MSAEEAFLGRLYGPLFSTPELDAIFSSQGLAVQMLEFEWALALSLEQSGVIPQGVANAIKAVSVDALDMRAIAQGAAQAGNIAIPFLSALRAQIAHREQSLADYVHWAATSQDLLDTATVLQCRKALALIQTDVGTICENLVTAIELHRDTIMPGRTWLQNAPPVTWGLKLAGWLDVFQRHRTRLSESFSRCITLQFGGAVGTLAALGSDGFRVSHDLTNALGLPEANLPWHSHRDRVAELATTLGLLTGSLGKIARDVSLLMQSEVAEVFEQAGEGSASSTMPHKRNPVRSSILLGASTRVPGLVATMLSAMVQEHERGLGGWQAEWETLVEIFRMTGGAVRAARHMIDGLEIDLNAMQQHLSANGGVGLSEALSFALATKIGKAPAHRLLERVTRAALKEHLSLREAALHSQDICEHLSIEQIDQALDPRNYLGSTQAFINRVLDSEGNR